MLTEKKEDVPKVSGVLNWTDRGTVLDHISNDTSEKALTDTSKFVLA